MLQFKEILQKEKYTVPYGQEKNPNLLIPGQGTIQFLNLTPEKPFRVTVASLNQEVVLSVSNSIDIILNGMPLPPNYFYQKPRAGLTNDPRTPYWISLDTINKTLSYGKGEMRLGTELMRWQFSNIETLDLSDAKSFGLSENLSPVRVLRDPVTSEPPMYVVDHNLITMEDVARGIKTTPSTLSDGCKKLYDLVAGSNFTLDTEDFPHFSEAIRRSILNPEGWCYKKLQEKSSEFGAPNPDQTYLRITLGQNSGESPGIPLVMEIWAPGHYSPIHNHAHANAVIKVLHGSITVNLYPYLSTKETESFQTVTFKAGDVTWISPALNQIHQLRNTDLKGDPCITIQCYLYDQDDHSHYKYFDYLSEGDIEQFTPNSDMDFLQFKQTMRTEWNIFYK